jgi:hypothetical protein
MRAKHWSASTTYALGGGSRAHLDGSNPLGFLVIRQHPPLHACQQLAAHLWLWLVPFVRVGEVGDLDSEYAEKQNRTTHGHHSAKKGTAKREDITRLRYSQYAKSLNSRLMLEEGAYTLLERCGTCANVIGLGL